MTGRMLNLMVRFASLLLAWALAAHVAHAQWTPSGVAGQSTAPLSDPGKALALASAARVLLVGQDDNRLAVVNPDTGAVLGSVQLPYEPIAVAVSSDGTRAYVVYGNSKLTAVNVTTRTVIGTWTVGGDLRSVALMPGEADVAVADAGPNRLLRVNASTGAIAQTLSLAHEPREVIRGNGDAKLIVGATNGWLITVDGGSFSVLSQFKLADEIRSLTWWEAGARALVVHKRADAVSVVNVSTSQVTATVQLDGDPDRAAVAAGIAYVATHDDASINRVDLAGPTLLGRYAIAARVNALVFDPAANVLIGALRSDQKLVRLDPAAASLISVLQLQKRLRDVAVNPVTHEAVAVADKSDEMFVVKLSDRSVRQIGLPARPDLVAVDSQLNRAVVAFRGWSGAKLRFADLAAGTLFPQAISYDRDIEAIAVDSTRSLAVAIVDGSRPVLFIDVNTRTRLADGPSDRYRALAIHTGRGVAYLATDDRELKVMDLASRTITATIDLGFKVNAIAVDEVLDRAVLTTDSGNKARVLDLATLALGANHALPSHPGAAALQPDTHVAVVTSRESDKVSLVDLNTGTATSGFTSIEKPHTVAVSARYNQALILSGERDEMAFVQLPNPVPVLEALAPTQAPAGNPGLVLTLTGKGFVDASKAYFGAAALATRWLSATQLEADVPAALLATPATVQVTVQNPAPAGGTSNALAFVVGGTPVVTALQPSSAPADGVAKPLTLIGQNFAAGAQVIFGAISLAPSSVTSTSITVTVPAAQTLVPGVTPVSVLNPGGQFSNSLQFTLTPALAINAIAPTSGEVGTLVTLTGTGFDPSPTANTLVFRGINSTLVGAAVLTASATQLTLKVPPLAETGPITLTNSRGTVQSPVFTVVRDQDFQLIVNPATVTVYQAASNSVQAQLSSTGGKAFTGLVTLSVQGLPSEVAASFAPQTLSAFQAGTITFGALGAAAPGNYPVTVTAEMKEGGVSFTRKANATLTVQSSAGITGVKGRFVTPAGAGIAGVIVRADIGTTPQPQTTTNAAGNFQLTGLPAGTITMRFDATPAHPLYPIWPQTIDVPANKMFVMEDWIIAPPPPDERFTTVVPNSPITQVITDPRFPGLEIKIPAGTSIIGWDGVPKSRIAVERLDPDKLPVAGPPIKTKSVYQLYFGTPMGGLPSNPIPVTLPNDLGLEPGAKTPLWYYDGSPMGGTGEWKMGGTGTVSADGSVIVTDSGSGIPRFCGVCGLPCFEAAQNEAPNPPPCCDQAKQTYGKPVNLATGQELDGAIDLIVDGEVPIIIRRTFNPFDAFAYIANFQQSLGVNWTFGGYDVAMLPFGGDYTVRIVLPGNARVDFKRGADGKFRSGGYNMFDGAEISKIGGSNPTSQGPLFGGSQPPPPGGAPLAPTCSNDGSTYVMRFRDGKEWRFDPAPNATKIRINGGCLYFLSEMRDGQGRFLQIQRGDGKIQRISTSSGQFVNFTYSTGVVSSVTDNAGRTVTYTHESVPTKGGFRALGATTDGTSSSRAATESAAIAAGLIPIPPRRLVSATTPEGTYAYTYEDDPPTLRLGALSFTDGSSGGSPISAESPSCQNVRGGTRLKTIQLPGVQGVFTNYYGPSKRVLRQTWPDGTDIRFNYKVVGGCVPGLFSHASQPSQGAPISGGSNTSTCRGAGCARLDSWEGQAVTGGTVVGVEVVDSRGNKFTRDFNQVGLPTKVVDENGQELTLLRDSQNRVVRSTDALGRATFFEYDGNGNRTKITDPAGRVTDIVYDGKWNKPTLMIRRLDAGTVIQFHYSYDTATGVLRSSTDPEGNVTTYEYDANRRLRVVRDPLLHETLLEYDSRGNPSRITDPLGNSVEMTTDAFGRVTETVDALGYPTRASYNSLNQLTALTDPMAGVTRFNFDSRNNLASVVNPLNQTLESYQYDGIGRLVAKTDAKSRTETYGYDENGNLKTLVDRRTQATSLEYDKANRPARINYPDGAVQDRSYDAAGRLIEIRETDNAQRMEYDQLDRVVRVTTDTLAGLTSMAYEYDALDRRTKRTVAYPGGVLEETTYSYDKASRITSIAQSGPNGAQLTTYSWDAASRLTQKTLPNGVRQILAYDDANRLASITYRSPNDSLIEFVQYTYDANGQRRSRSTGTASRGETPLTASYDQANRMTSITLNPGTASAKTYNLTYDDSGNLVRKQNAAVPAEDTIYQWDGRNRLISITASAAGSSSTAAFKYDALGRRIERTVSQGVGTQRTQYVYDGIQAIGELVDGRLAATILTGLNIDEVIARTVNVATATSENPIATKTYLTDALGSVLAVLRADQSAEAFYAYSPHGETSQLGADPDRPVSAYQYTARENDGAVGGTDGGSLYFYRARFYDPVLKRFLSEDPIGLAGGFNLSAYLAGDPVSFTDPTGEFLFVPMLVGALWGAGTDIAIQLIMNGGRLECIDLGQVALSAALGAVGGGVGGYVAKLRNVRQAYQNGLAAAREADLSAQQAWATRRALGQAGKQNTPPGARGLIYGRNTRQYGDELGPAFDPVKMADPMKTLTDTNKYADQLLKLPPRGLPSAGGAAGGAAGAGIGGGGSECGCNN